MLTREVPRYTDEAASLDVTLQNLDKLWVSASVISTYLSLYVCIRRRSCQPRCHTTRLGQTLGECMYKTHIHTHIKYMYISYHTHIHDLIKVLVSACAHLRFLCPVKGCVCVCVCMCVYFHGERRAHVSFLMIV